jgi:hypothetical protein
MPAAFAIMRISHEDSAIGLVVRLARTPDMIKAPIMGQCALVQAKVRRRHTTFKLGRLRSICAIVSK